MTAWVGTHSCLKLRVFHFLSSHVDPHFKGPMSPSVLHRIGTQGEAGWWEADCKDHSRAGTALPSGKASKPEGPCEGWKETPGT